VFVLVNKVISMEVNKEIEQSHYEKYHYLFKTCELCGDKVPHLMSFKNREGLWCCDDCYRSSTKYTREQRYITESGNTKIMTCSFQNCKKVV